MKWPHCWHVIGYTGIEQCCWCNQVRRIAYQRETDPLHGKFLTLPVWVYEDSNQPYWISDSNFDPYQEPECVERSASPYAPMIGGK